MENSEETSRVTRREVLMTWTKETARQEDIKEVNLPDYLVG